MPRIAANARAVAVGYTGYLLSAILLAAIAVLLAQLFRDLPHAPHARRIATLSIVFGSLASFAKLLGITRWLTAMPLLVEAFTNPATDGATRAALVVVYTTLNAYAGGLGELIGVALFSGLWTLTAAWLVLRAGYPRWLGWFGIGAGIVSLVLSLELTGVVFDASFIIVQGVIWQL